MISQTFVVTRATATKAAQAVLAALPTSWVWSKKTQQQWTDDLALIDQLDTAEVNARTVWRNAAELWQADLDRLQSITRLVAAFGQVQFRDNPVLATSFKKLGTQGRSRAAMYEQAKAALAVWQAADPAWEFAADAETFEVAVLGSLIAAADAKGTTHAGKLALWSNAAKALRTKLRVVDRDNVHWYSDATRRFPEGTTPGDMIRAAVPTTTRPEEPVGQAVLANVMVAGDVIHFDCAAPHATKFTYLHLSPGAAAFVVVVTDSPDAHLTLHNQAAGLHKFKALGRNSRGEGPESVIVEVTVAQQNVA